ncbi:putative methionine precursor/uptake ABC transporter, MtsV [Enterococcus faecalis]|nr:putative methionine precursor/uptake ABC transporter, MtsV [Enterococcus faecalis]
MSERQMLGYHPDSTWIHRLNGTSKLVFFNRCLCGLYDHV